MESLTNAPKRKKRKTRKCLDEIRKRSRRTRQILFEKDSDKVSHLFSNYNNVNKCLITSNRLTLKMFPKAVRSETITRPVLADLNKKPILKLDELVKSTKDSSSTKVRLPELIGALNNNIEHFKKEHLQLESYNCPHKDSFNYKESDVKNTNSQDKLSSNFDLFTSMDSAEATDKSPDSIGAQSVSTLNTSSNQSLHDVSGYNLYKEFMSEIPTYLKQNAILIKEDVMKKTKTFLQNLFIESCYQECEDNVLKCIKNNSAKKIFYSPGEIIVHNPMDYIRLGQVQEQSLYHQSLRIGGTTNGNCSIPRSPLMAPPSPDSQMSVTVQDTPDYTYYPHRLN